MTEKRKRNLASAQNTFCITAEDLQKYLTKHIEREDRIRIFKHLQKCERCRRLYEDLQCLQEIGNEIDGIILRKNSINNSMGKFVSRPQFTTLEKLSSGQIWTTLTTILDSEGHKVMTVPMATPVLIIWPGNDGQKKLDNLIRVIPISLDTEFAVLNEDIILKKNPLEYEILLTVWNEIPMLAGNLGEFRGQISDYDLHKIVNIRKKILSEIGTRKGYSADVKKWRRIEMQRMKYLSAPISQLA
jgi:hypothetical protein